MGRLVEDLLDLARVDAGKAPLTPEPVARRPAARRRRRRGRGCSAATCEYDVRVDPADLVVRADPARLRQLVANLLDNASRHSPAGGTVVVTAARHGDRFRLEVHDQGPGVAAEDRERVFEPFGTLTRHRGRRRDRPRPRDRPLGHRPPRRHASASSTPSRGDAGRPRPRRPAARAARPTRHPPGGHRCPPRPAARTDARSRADTGAGRRAGPLLDDIFGGFWPERGVPARLSVLLGAVGVGAPRRGGAALPGPRARHLPRAARRGWRRARREPTPSGPVHPHVRGAVRAARGDDRGPRRRLDRGPLPAGRRRAVRVRRDPRPHAARLRAVRAGLAARRAPGSAVARPHPRARSPGWDTGPRCCARSSGRSSASSSSARSSPPPTPWSPSGWTPCCPDLTLGHVRAARVPRRWLSAARCWPRRTSPSTRRGSTATG